MSVEATGGPAPERELPSDADVQAQFFRILEAVFDVPVTGSAVLGQSGMEVSQLLKLSKQGTIVELDRKVGEAIDIYVNDRLVARGEVVPRGRASRRDHDGNHQGRSSPRPEVGERKVRISYASSSSAGSQGQIGARQPRSRWIAAPRSPTAIDIDQAQWRNCAAGPRRGPRHGGCSAPTSGASSRPRWRPNASAPPVVACGVGTDAGARWGDPAGAKEYLPLPPDAELIAAVLEAIADESHRSSHGRP